MNRPIRDYLSQLDRFLTITRSEKRKTIAEINDYLLEAKAQEIDRGASPHQAEEIAIQRLGSASELARRLGGGGASLTLPSRLTGASGRFSRRKRYPPLAVLAVGVFLAATILPSALNLPQSNPSQTLEYAPVPPEGDDNPPPGGNLSSLGLGSSSSLKQGFSETPGDQFGSSSAGQRRNPSSKRCVGKPPRQTEDPLAPPCVAYFEGNNFGATHPGVTASEIRVLIYYDGSISGDPPCQSYYDLNEPTPADAGPQAAFNMAPFRIYQRYFNDRFQTYNRKAHMFLYHAHCDFSAESRLADAADNFRVVRPFAVLNFAYDYAPTYSQAMASRGVLIFGSAFQHTAAFHRGHPGFVWGYRPTYEHQVDLYTSYLCKKVVPHRVSFGRQEDFGKVRKFGLLYTDTESFPDLQYVGELVRKKVEACGGDIAVSRGMPYASRNDAYAAQNIAAFQDEKVTTLLWTGLYESRQSQVATAVRYTPEILVMGQHDGSDNNSNISSQRSGQEFWNHAWAVTNYAREGPIREEVCAQAILDAEPQADEDAVFLGCFWYHHVFQLFVGIQVAGPRLTPANVEDGFRAIPAKASTSPKAPACFYEPNDFTCVKDAAAEWWDSEGRPPWQRQTSPVTGCWRMAEEGKRYLEASWPEGDVLAQQKRGTDPCNAV